MEIITFLFKQGYGRPINPKSTIPRKKLFIFSTKRRAPFGARRF